MWTLETPIYFKNKILIARPSEWKNMQNNPNSNCKSRPPGEIDYIKQTATSKKTRHPIVSLIQSNSSKFWGNNQQMLAYTKYQFRL